MTRAVQSARFNPGHAAYTPGLATGLVGTPLPPPPRRSRPRALAQGLRRSWFIRGSGRLPTHWHRAVLSVPGHTFQIAEVLVPAAHYASLSPYEGFLMELVYM